MHVSFAGALDPAVAGPFTADALNITVNNDFPGPMAPYRVTGTSSVARLLLIGLALSDFTGSAFAGTALPRVAPSLGAFQSVRFERFAGTLDSPIEAEGTLATLRCAAGCTVCPSRRRRCIAVALAAAAVSRPDFRSPSTSPEATGWAAIPRCPITYVNITVRNGTIAAWVPTACTSSATRCAWKTCACTTTPSAGPW